MFSCCTPPPAPDLDNALLVAIQRARDAEKDRVLALQAQKEITEEQLERNMAAFDQEAIRGTSFIKHGRQVSMRGLIFDSLTCD